jgi:hypothetical protein
MYLSFVNSVELLVSPVVNNRAYFKVTFNPEATWNSLFLAVTYTYSPVHVNSCTLWYLVSRQRNKESDWCQPVTRSSVVEITNHSTLSVANTCGPRIAEVGNISQSMWLSIAVLRVMCWLGASPRHVGRTVIASWGASAQSFQFCGRCRQCSTRGRNHRFVEINSMALLPAEEDVSGPLRLASCIWIITSPSDFLRGWGYVYSLSVYTICPLPWAVSIIGKSIFLGVLYASL